MAWMNWGLRSVIGAVKDQTSIGLAKVASTRTPDVDVAVVKATSHEEMPVDERYVWELLHLTSTSCTHASVCTAALSKRLGKTRNWVVAIKALMLTHHLLRDGNPAFERELLCYTRGGVRVLNLSNFRDNSHSNTWDYSAFIRTYALFLDERLDCFMGQKSFLSHQIGYTHYETEPQRQSKNRGGIKDMTPGEILKRLPPLLRVLDRVIACCPTGAARSNRLVQIALYPIVGESFEIYRDVCDGLAIILNAFFEMGQPDGQRVLDIYSQAAKQADELASFFQICRDLGVCKSMEYPPVQKISEELLETMEDFLLDRPKSPERVLELRSLRLPPDFDEEPPKPEIPSPILQKQENDADLLNLDKVAVSAQECGDRLALALLSGNQSTANLNSGMFSSLQANGVTNTASVSTGWELALANSATSHLVEMSESAQMGGGFDHLILDSLYERAINEQRYHPTTTSTGSASSVALSGCPSSSYLALPGPSPSNDIGEDPFSASSVFPPPSYVQMSDMRTKQQLLVQEQQLWVQHQRDGMQGCTGVMKLYGHPYVVAPYQSGYVAPYYGMGGSYATTYL